jgi:hypothetical protein
MKRTILILAVLTALTGLAACNESRPKKADTPSESSQQGSMGRGHGPVRAACDAEIKKLCTGDERAGQCLRAHESELSDGCKAALATRGQQR